MTTKQKLTLFIGSYSEVGSESVHTYSMDEESGKLTKLGVLQGLKNPTFLNLDTQQQKLYTFSEGISPDGERTTEAVALEYSPETLKLSETSRSLGRAGSSCHIQRDRSSRYLVLSSYNGGSVSLVALTEEGEIGEWLDVQKHEGHGVNLDRQEGPHPHSAQFSPDGKYIYVPDLGIDRIKIYTIDSSQQKLIPHGEVSLRPGAGPRHMTFHPNSAFAYVINELDSTVTAFTYDQATGSLEEISTVPTLPTAWQGENICAEVAISEDGRYLYGSNRGHDSLVVFKIMTDGKLTYVEHVSVEGAHPRHFALAPGGKFLVAANRDTNNLAVFRIDPTTGKLQFTGESESVSKPVCVVPAYL
ncbi:lactonase family protein [Bacillus horti]|uniref:6-phosphogluconolactonase n=1 Tax=Caldalkalibacillus horti TaxID=77523 RepID=A0ABT9VVT4_9BACI|nr:lactonase family protein [Bacillus horti]MDQ0165106.1 6-phosphogluconolactonase [Bacillus horti]